MSDFDPTMPQTDFMDRWAGQNIDPLTGALLVTDPAKAIDNMIAKGVPPPSGHVMAYDDPAGGSNSDGAMPVFNDRGKMMGNMTSAQGQPPVAAPALAASKAPPVAASSSPFDPVPEPAASVPLPMSRPVEAGPGASDISAAAKKPSAADAFSDFSKSMAGVKPIQPAPVNPVGTPGVRSPGAVGAPNIQALLQMIGQQSGASPLSTLGRLLVAGKA